MFWLQGRVDRYGPVVRAFYEHHVPAVVRTKGLSRPSTPGCCRSWERRPSVLGSYGVFRPAPPSLHDSPYAAAAIAIITVLGLPEFHPIPSPSAVPTRPVWRERCGMPKLDGKQTRVCVFSIDSRFVAHALSLLSVSVYLRGGRSDRLLPSHCRVWEELPNKPKTELTEDSGAGKE